jgi:nucleotide-binding universal stress UspA family protein
MLNLAKKILVAIDGSPQSDKAAEEAVRLAAGNPSKFISTIYAMLVLPNTPNPTFADFIPKGPVTQTKEWEELRQRVFFVIDKDASEMGIPLEVRIAYGDPAEELINFARKEGIDVIVIGSSGKGFLKRNIMGSVSYKVVNNSPCSVYIVKG